MPRTRQSRPRPRPRAHSTDVVLVKSRDRVLEKLDGQNIASDSRGPAGPQVTLPKSDSLTKEGGNVPNHGTEQKTSGLGTASPSGGSPTLSRRIRSAPHRGGLGGGLLAIYVDQVSYVCLRLGPDLEDWVDTVSRLVQDATQAQAYNTAKGKAKSDPPILLSNVTSTSLTTHKKKGAKSLGLFLQDQRRTGAGTRGHRLRSFTPVLVPPPPPR